MRAKNYHAPHIISIRILKHLPFREIVSGIRQHSNHAIWAELEPFLQSYYNWHAEDDWDFARRLARLLDVEGHDVVSVFERKRGALKSKAHYFALVNLHSLADEIEARLGEGETFSWSTPGVVVKVQPLNPRNTRK